MSIYSGIAKFQNHCRNSGWRIKAIPWWGRGKIEVSQTTTLCNWVGLLGVAFIPLAFWLGYSKILTPLEALPVGLCSFFILLFCIPLNDWDIYRKWLPADARLLDIEVGEITVTYNSDPHHSAKRWVFRSLCEFSVDDQVYKVTPDIAAHYKSKREVLEYIEKSTFVKAGEKHVRIYFDPKTPLHAIFNNRPNLAKPFQLLGMTYKD